MSKRTVTLHIDPKQMDSLQSEANRVIGFFSSYNMDVYDEVEIALVNSKELQAMYTNSANKARRLVTMRFENRLWTSVK